MEQDFVVRSVLITAIVCLISLIGSQAIEARGRSGIGPRVGMETEPDRAVVGLQAELGAFFGPATLVPSLDLTLGDTETTSILNMDLRWYLLPLPDSGIFFYGSAGPSFVTAPNADIGLSLVAGAHIPMSGRNRYNLEARFGFGDIPDLKVMLGILFQ